MEHVGLQYLQKARGVFVKWKMAGTTNSGLTSETFTTCIKTIGAINDLAIYLQQMHGFSYVLTRKFLSDPIKGRLGSYRQVHGSNFNILIHWGLQAKEKFTA